MMTGNENIKYLIVPDIHGRDFWREPVNNILQETDAKIIFLGDYVDPYYGEFYDGDEDKWLVEGINSWENLSDYVVKTLTDIIELKKQYPERIILLLGNHDCSYAISTMICNCRHERPRHADMLRKLFNENRDLFQLAHEDYVNDIHYIFSHAGINKQYAYDCFGNKVTEENVVELFNKAYEEDNYGIMESLALFSHWRGGWRSNYGSLVWADAREWMQDKEEAYGFSVVGHTQLKSHAIEDNFAFLDSRECFYMENNGNIKKSHE
jgi:hypothetical protein